MKVNKIISFILFLLCCIYIAKGQEDQIRFEHLTKAAGLSQSTVYSIIQDKHGFIWIGTGDGLNRYDGYTLKKYFHDSEKPNSLSNNRVYNLLIDRDGELWIATLGGGLNKYRVETDDFIAYRNKKDDPQSISQDVVMSLFEDKNGFMWVGTAEGGLNKFDKKKGIFTSYKHDPNNPNSIANNIVISIASDRNGNLWLAYTQMGLDMFNPQKNTFTHYKNDPKNLNSISSNRLNHIFADSRGLIWISTNNGLNLLDPETSTIKRLYASSDPNSLRINDTHCVFEDKDQNIWVGTYGGLSLLRKDCLTTFKFRNYFNNPLDSYSLSNDQIRCFFQDRSGLIWVGSFSNGVDKFDPKPSGFTSYHSEPGNKQNLSHNSIRCFKEDKAGYIWIGTFGGGFNRFDPRSEQFQSFRRDTSDKNSLTIDFINSICIDADDNLWIGTYGGGLDFYNQKTQKFKHYSNKLDNPKSLSDNYIRSMTFDKYGFLWIATSGGGLNLFDPQKEEFIHYRNDSKNSKSISSNRIFCIYETRDDHTLWIGTGNGLNKFNREDSSFTRFTKKDGFSSDVILGILEDKSGFLWLSTMDGLYKFDAQSSEGKILKIYDDKDGLNSGEFSEGAYFRDAKGKLYFGGFKGFTVFDPTKIIDNPSKPSTYIVDFQIFNKSVQIDSASILKKNIILTKDIHLNYSDYVFSFEFAALNYKNSDKNQYQYKMDMFDEEWISTDAKRRFITYTNLDPGEYMFMVKASNNDGLWNETSTNIKIIIHPPFYQTWWFRVLMAIFIFACLFGFYRWRIAAFRRQKKQLEQTVKEKTAVVVQQKEELQAFNKELRATNEELYNQREELDLTVHSLKEAQKQLVQSEKMASLGVLAAGIAHEINNPLNFIHGGIRGIENHFEENPNDHNSNVQFFITAIKEGVKRSVDIVAGLNLFSRSGEFISDKVDIHTIIDNCLLMLQNKTKNRIEIIKKYTNQQYTLIGNEGKLHQAILNILANAVQANDDKGTITINTEVEGVKIKISVIDTGCGVKEEDLPKILDPFFTTKETGTGLGLSITYTILQEHDGTIEFESKLGKGTTAIISLPIK